MSAWVVWIAFAPRRIEASGSGGPGGEAAGEDERQRDGGDADETTVHGWASRLRVRCCECGAAGAMLWCGAVVR